MAHDSIIRRLTSRSFLAAVSFMLMLIVSLAVTAMGVADIVNRRADLVASEDLLDQLRGRGTRSSAGPQVNQERSGSFFLEGKTLTVAGATLLQRVAGAITQAGGIVQSSQINLDSVRSKDGFVGLLISGEADQLALQKLLYDIESGMPFLFIDQLDVQMPQATAANEMTTGRAKVVLGVSGQWQRGK